MSIGSFDEDEHERREKKNATVDISEDDDRTNFQGKIEYDSGESAQSLIDQFKKLKRN